MPWHALTGFERPKVFKLPLQARENESSEGVGQHEVEKFEYFDPICIIRRGYGHRQFHERVRG